MMRAKACVLTLLGTMSAWAQVGTNTTDTLHWNSARALKVDDFKMAPMEFTGMGGEAVCLLLADYKQKNPMAKPEYNACASFDRAKSWIQKGGSLEADLRFFQVMFDIYELHARMLKRDLIAGSPVTGIDAYLQAQYNTAMGTAMDEFNQFRRESQMGKNHDVVKKWSDRVRRDIAANENHTQR